MTFDVTKLESGALEISCAGGTMRVYATGANEIRYDIEESAPAKLSGSGKTKKEKGITVIEPIYVLDVGMPDTDKVFAKLFLKPAPGTTLLPHDDFETLLNDLQVHAGMPADEPAVNLLWTQGKSLRVSDLTDRLSKRLNRPVEVTISADPVLPGVKRL